MPTVIGAEERRIFERYVAAVLDRLSSDRCDLAAAQSDLVTALEAATRGHGVFDVIRLKLDLFEHDHA